MTPTSFDFPRDATACVGHFSMRNNLTINEYQVDDELSANVGKNVRKETQFRKAETCMNISFNSAEAASRSAN
jgi:hypothetical protein